MLLRGWDMREAVFRAGCSLLFAGFLGAGLGGCTFPEPDINWSKPNAGRGSAIAQCYRTLAEPDCKTELQPYEAHREVGWFDGGRPPAQDPDAE